MQISFRLEKEKYMSNQLTVRQAFLKSANSTPNSVIVANAALAALSSFGRIRSLRTGQDVRFGAGVRPMNTPRRCLMGANIAVATTGSALAVAQAVVRARTEPDASYGYHNKPSKDLVAEVVVNTVFITLAAIELRRGTSLLYKRPISPYGHAVNAAGIGTVAFKLGLASRELYRRRDTWLPGVKMHAAAAPSIVKASIRGRKRRTKLSDSTVDLMALHLADLEQHVLAAIEEFNREGSTRSSGYRFAESDSGDTLQPRTSMNSPAEQRAYLESLGVPAEEIDSLVGNAANVADELSWSQRPEERE